MKHKTTYRFPSPPAAQNATMRSQKEEQWMCRNKTPGGLKDDEDMKDSPEERRKLI